MSAGNDERGRMQLNATGGWSGRLRSRPVPENDATIDHEALVDALRSLIVPGFEQLGTDVSALKKWLDEGASTETIPV